MVGVWRRKESMSIQSFERTVPVGGIRIEIVADVSFEQFRRAFEAEVPPVDEALFRRLVDEGAPWSRFVQASGGNGVHSFVTFWNNDPSAIMRVGGTDRASAS